ncbi:hypothetical protein ACOMHN_049587 [Nucella lapillus]
MLQDSVFKSSILNFLLYFVLPACSYGNTRAENFAVASPLSYPLHRSPADMDSKRQGTKPHTQPSQQLCTRCELLPRTEIFLPCCHWLMCSHCGDDTETCPTCENHILATVKHSDSQPSPR